MIHIFGFKKQCVPFIESGRKVSTIREDRKDGRVPRPGDTLRLYTGLRSKSCQLLRETKNFKSAKLFLQEDDSVWFQNQTHGSFMSDEQKEN
ncbi:MAG: hypothetical protein ACE5GM_11395 [bacterium]